MKPADGFKSGLVDEADMLRWMPNWREAQKAEFLTFGRCVALAQSKLQAPPQPTEQQIAVLARLAAIADAYERSGLDEARPEEEHTPQEREKIVLLSGRGGKTLLTLADAFAAREALRAAPAPAPAPTDTDSAPVGPILPDRFYLAHGPTPPRIVEIRFPNSWRPKPVQESTELGFTVEGIEGWFRYSDEGKSWRWPQGTTADQKR